MVILQRTGNIRGDFYIEFKLQHDSSTFVGTAKG